MTERRLDSKRTLGTRAAPGNMGSAISAQVIAEGVRIAVAGRRAVAALILEIGGAAVVWDITGLPSVERTVKHTREWLDCLDSGVNAADAFSRCSSIPIKSIFSAWPPFIGLFRSFQAIGHTMRDGCLISQNSSVTAPIMMYEHAGCIGIQAGWITSCSVSPINTRKAASESARLPRALTPMRSCQVAAFRLWPSVHSMREIPLQRPDVSKDVIDATIWLAGDEASFLREQTIHVSGGQTLRRKPSLADLHAVLGVQA